MKSESNMSTVFLEELGWMELFVLPNTSGVSMLGGGERGGGGEKGSILTL